MTAPVNHALTGLRECLIDFGIIQITMIPVRIHIGSVAQQITNFLIPCSELRDC